MVVLARNPNRQRRTGGRLALFITGQFFKWLGILLLTLIIGAVITGLFFLGYAKTYLEDVIEPQAVEAQNALDIAAYDPSLSSTIYYYDSSVGDYVEMETLYAEENRIWVTYDNIPENLINATVAIEDQRFWEHEGVDWKRTLGAVYYMFTGGNVQGGSTITQQLIKNLSQNDDVTVKRKVLEIFSALEFSKNHTKEETLELYLNYIYLGRRCDGIYTAAYRYFDKDVSELDLAECASLISITNNPSLYDPISHMDNNLKRAHLVLNQMYKQGYISHQEELDAMAEIGYFPDGVDEEGEELFAYDESRVQIQFKLTMGVGSGSSGADNEIRSWYADAVIDSVLDDLMEEFGYTKEAANQVLFCGGLKIYTCYDPVAQAAVDAVYSDPELLADYAEKYASAKGQPLQSAISVVDNTTGAVVAMGQLAEKEVNRAWVQSTDTKRQPGSSIKPIAVYAPALEEGLITPYSAVEDTPFKIDDSGRPWPKNSSGNYTGWTDIYTAVIKSLNTCAVKTLDLVGIETSYDYLENRFGISSLVSYMEGSDGRIHSDFDYAPLALGGLTEGVSTFEMAGAFSTFPRNGSFVEPHLYTKVLDSDGNVLLENDETGVQTLSEKTCYYMNQMLTGVVSSGTGTKARIDGMTAAGKTGTTTNNYDRWFCGYTGYYTAAVWIGYDTSEKIAFDGNPATLLWQKVMSNLVAGKPDVDLTHTDLEIVTASICTRSGLLSTSACSAAGCSRTGYFVAGDAPSEYCEWHTEVKVCIGTGDGTYYEASEYCPEECVQTHVVFNKDNSSNSNSMTIEDEDAEGGAIVTQGICPIHTAEWAANKDLWSQQTITAAIGTYQGPVGASFAIGAVSADLAGNPGGALTYSSSNPAVATVDESGHVTLVGEGTATITVTAAKTIYAPEATLSVPVVAISNMVPENPGTPSTPEEPGTPQQPTEPETPDPPTEPGGSSGSGSAP